MLILMLKIILWFIDKEVEQFFENSKFKKPTHTKEKDEVDEKEEIVVGTADLLSTDVAMFSRLLDPKTKLLLSKKDICVT